MSNQIKCVIVDDEEDGRIALSNMIGSFCPELQLCGTAANAIEAFDMIREHQPEILFLDIEMPGATGFDLLEKLPNREFDTIFTTAYENHAIKAFKVDAKDYLLKPVDPLELKAAVDRIITKRQGSTSSITEKQIKNRISLPTGKGLKFIETKEIVRCESDNIYTTFYLKNGDSILVTKSIKEYEEQLHGIGFFRVHRSHLINMSEVSEYVRTDGNHVIMSDGSRVDIARRKKDDFLEALDQHG